jgi:hypothetical protein
VLTGTGEDFRKKIRVQRRGQALAAQAFLARVLLNKLMAKRRRTAEFAPEKLKVKQ